MGTVGCNGFRNPAELVSPRCPANQSPTHSIERRFMEPCRTCPTWIETGDWHFATDEPPPSPKEREGAERCRFCRNTNLQSREKDIQMRKMETQEKHLQKKARAGGHLRVRTKQQRWHSGKHEQPTRGKKRITKPGPEEHLRRNACQ